MSLKEELFSLIIVILVILLLNNGHKTIYDYFNTYSTMSNYDQRKYKVVGGFSDRQDAANHLAKLHEFIINYLRYVKKKFIIYNNGTEEQKKFFIRVLKNYNPDNLFENDPKPGDDTSFVANKGEEFGVCLRKKGKYKNKIHEMSILKFVILHELTHLGCISYGHGQEFWDFFKMVLTEAVESGLYTPIDYSKNPINYCGLEVFHNPYCDEVNKCL